MLEIYRKEGRVVRYENGRTIAVLEAGEATEDGSLFRCGPSGASVTIPEIGRERVSQIAKDIDQLVSHPLKLERLIVSEGVAKHSFGDVKWEERTLRVHAAIVCRALRVLIDLGDDDLADVREIASMFPHARAEREAPLRLRLRPAVAAALLPSLVGVAPPNVTLLQSAGGFDGKGVAITEQTISAAPFPNWYRPSYRVRPVRMPLNLRLKSSVEHVRDDIPVAIALLAPADGLTLRLLCVDGEGVFPATVRVTRIESADEKVRWYPYGAGSFGAEMVL